MLEKKHNKIITIVLILYVLSIFLDLHIFYNSISTLIRCIIATGLFVFAFIKLGNKKERKYLIIYFLLYLLFIIIHLINIRNCSYLKELLYFYKMTSSIFIIYTVYKLKITLNDFYKVLNPCLLLISGSIVLCNFLKIGYSSYDFYPIRHNIFEWFKYDNLNFIDASSKGYFHLTNQITAILILYLPLLISKIKNNLNFYNIFCLVITLLSLLMLGNRISSIVPLIIMFVAIIIYFVLWIIKKSKFNHRFIAILFIIMGGYIIIFSSSPLLNRYEYYDDLTAYAKTDEKIVKKLAKRIFTKDEEKQDQKRQENIRNVFDQKLININFPMYYYPYDEDKEFWDKMLKYDSNILYNARFLEKSIVKRVVKLNNNKVMDHLFGIGYDRIMNIQNIEQDYIMQYYSIGIIGCIILIGIYIVLYLYLIIKVLFNFDTKIKYHNLMILLGIGTFLVSAYFSGNLLNAVSTTIPLSFVMGIALVEIKKKESKYPNYILGFKVFNEGENKLLNEIFKSKKQNIIFNINPLIVTNFYQNKKVVNVFNEQDYNIPDGSGIILASKMKDGNIDSQISGVELVEKICEKSVKAKYKVYLYGSKDGVAIKAKENLEKKYKGINIVGISNGYIKESDALKEILKKKPDILFVAMGSPKQENFIINNKEKLKNIKIIMPVGGSLDVISGNTKRAPKMWSKLHLEWLYRMIKEPKRIKQNINLFKYIWLVIFKNDKYNKKSN